MSKITNKNLYLALLAEQCSKYDQMLFYLEEYLKVQKEDLNKDERRMVFNAFKSSINNKRKSMKNILDYEIFQRNKDQNEFIPFIEVYKSQLEIDLKNYCQKIINIINDILLPLAKSDDSKVFYKTIIGDYNRYIAESIEGEMKYTFIEDALKEYKEAKEISNSLDLINPSKLELILNMSIFYVDILKDPNPGLELVNNLLNNIEEEGLSKMDKSSKEYNEINEIIETIKENIILWTHK